MLWFWICIESIYLPTLNYLGGEKWGGNGVGDDLYSFGFDGAYLWTGGRSTMVIPSVSQPHVKKGDNYDQNIFHLIVLFLLKQSRLKHHLINYS